MLQGENSAFERDGVMNEMGLKGNGGADRLLETRGIPKEDQNSHSRANSSVTRS